MALFWIAVALVCSPLLGLLPAAQGRMTPSVETAEPRAVYNWRVLQTALGYGFGLLASGLVALLYWFLFVYTRR